MHQYITSISLASFSCSSQQCSVICHHILMPVLSPWSPHPVCTDSHTLTVFLQGCFLSHLFPSLCFLTSPKWAGFFSRVGSTLLKLSGSPVHMMRCTWDSPCGTNVKTTHAAWAAATDHRPVTWPHFKPWFPPAPSKCQLILLVTHPRDFYKGQVSGLSQEEKQPWWYESEPQRKPCPWRFSAGPHGTLSGHVT